MPAREDGDGLPPDLAGVAVRLVGREAGLLAAEGHGRERARRRRRRRFEHLDLRRGGLRAGVAAAALADDEGDLVARAQTVPSPPTRGQRGRSRRPRAPR